MSVNVSNGNLVMKLATPAGGPYDPVSEFTYNSMASYRKIQYGYGMAGRFSQTLTSIDADTVKVVKGNGAAYSYTVRDASSNYYLPPARARNALKRIADGWTETQPDGVQLVYDIQPLSWDEMTLQGWDEMTLQGWDTFELAGTPTGVFGRLSQLQSPAGQIWTLTYSGSKLISITNPFSRLTTYVYDGSNNLQRIEDAAGRATTFTVDASGDLTQMITPELCITEMVYDSKHRMTAHVDPAGNRTSFTYVANRQIESIQTPQGDLTTYTYLSATSVKVTDALSRVTSLVLDASANVTAVVNPLGGRTTYTWSANQLTGITDANGNTNGISRASGLTNRTQPLSCISYAGGGCFTFSYDLTNDWIDTVTDEMGRDTTLVWDAGQRTGVIDALGNRTSYSYNSRGQVETLTNPLGHTTTYVYDSLGQVSAVDNPLGERTSFTYNGAGQQQTIQNALGSAGTAPAPRLAKARRATMRT